MTNKNCDLSFLAKECGVDQESMMSIVKAITEIRDPTVETNRIVQLCFEELLSLNSEHKFEGNIFDTDCVKNLVAASHYFFGFCVGLSIGLGIDFKNDDKTEEMFKKTSLLIENVARIFQLVSGIDDDSLSNPN